MRGRRHNDATASLADAFGQIRSDYNAARESRFRRRRTGVNPAGSGADYHYRSEADYLRLIEQARDMDRNDSVAGPLVDMAVGGTLQEEGFQLDPMTGDDGLDAELAERWWDWAEDPQACDLQGELCWNDLEWLALRQPFVDGDLFVLPTRDGALQFVEAHRCRSPQRTKQNIVHGVLLDANRRRREYWFCADDVGLNAQLKISDFSRYPAYDRTGEKTVFHVCNPKLKRSTQTRGVTALAPIFDCLGMFEDINFAKLVQQQVVSCFAVFRQLSADAPIIDGDDPQRGEETDDSFADGTTRTLTGIAPGMEIRGRPGETLEGFSPNVPNQEYFQHVKLILTLVGINLGVPLVALLMDASETNFSGWRGAIDQARQGFKRNQRWLTRRFHCPVYRWKVRQWGADDPAIARAIAKGNAFKHQWKYPTWPYIEPLKDAQADLLRDGNALISKRRLHAERGRDWDDLADEIVADNLSGILKAKEAAKTINAKFADDDDPVRWRDLLPLSAPDGVQVKSGQEPAPEPVGPGQKAKPAK